MHTLSPKQALFLQRVIATIDQLGMPAPTIAILSGAVPAPKQALEAILTLGERGGDVVRLGTESFLTRNKVEELHRRLQGEDGRERLSAREIRERLALSRSESDRLVEYWLEEGGLIQTDEGYLVSNLRSEASASSSESDGTNTELTEP